VDFYDWLNLQHATIPSEIIHTSEKPDDKVSNRTRSKTNRFVRVDGYMKKKIS
jgi:hypothetical protein